MKKLTLVLAVMVALSAGCQTFMPAFTRMKPEYEELPVETLKESALEIERAIQEGITILMTVQTLHGFTGMNVYSTGRELLDYGVIPGRNILPETGYVKLGWVLGQTNNHAEIKNLLLTNIAGEFVDREVPIAFNYNIDDLLNKKKL